jgi:hypothetical protein
MADRKDPDRRPKRKPLHRRAWVRAAAYMVGGLLVALGAVILMRSLDADRDAQRIAAFFVVVGALFLLLRNENIETKDPLTVLATLIGLGGAAVAALTLVGSIETPPPLGCINTDGPIRGTVGAETTTIYARATQASEPQGLLLRGCQLEFEGYCIGSVHFDATVDAVRDTRWMILSGGRGLVASGDTVGTTPRDLGPSKCAGGVPPPDRLVFHEAAIDGTSGLVRLQAVAPRAAVIGFALQLRDGRWRRLGWDKIADDDIPLVARVPAEARVGATVSATPCIAFQRPAGPTRYARLRRGDAAGRAPFVRQPVGWNPREVACQAGIVEPGS